MAERKHMVLGILAHVDAGKTTLSESLLYLSGKIRKQGRVDHKDAYLDTYALEKERGITIFSKQAELSFGDLSVTLLDTPGHVDFSPEMERVLSVLDGAVLVISAPDGITGQVRTLWRLLSFYEVPAFIFVNKMDQPGMDKEKILAEIREKLGTSCVDFTGEADGALETDARQEDLALCEDSLLEAYLECGRKVTGEDIRSLIGSRRLHPVFFGSALKNEGVRELAAALDRYSEARTYPEAFGARVFKISRDEQGTRLTWLRVTGGTLRVKMVLPDGRKIDQIRIYSGSGFESAQEVAAGGVAAVTGLDGSFAGEGLGEEKDGTARLLQPIFRSQVILRDGTDPAVAVKNLRELEEEEPMLQISFDARTREITARIMGEVETEILKNLCQERFGMAVEFGPASIVYKETIAAPAEGVGHYEPLRHYAEVHLMLEPTERGSGLSFASACPTDVLARNWQRLVLTHLMEKKHRGVLTGSELTDMRITLIGGRASEKHTSGGDFRQATYRAVRQGLMMTKSILLEPVCDFHAEIPEKNIGRLLSDIQRMEGKTDPPGGDGQTAEITGTVPAAEIGDYAGVLRAYTHGKGQISFSLKAYEPCRHPEEIILEKGYDPEADTENPADSVFCSHGAGVLVPWDQVRSYMHVKTGWQPYEEADQPGDAEGDSTPAESFSSDWQKKKKGGKQTWEDQEKERESTEKELQSIFEKTYTGSSWHTPVRSSQNSYSNEPGFWSRDGSLERAEAEKTEKEKQARQAEKQAASGSHGSAAGGSGGRTPGSGRQSEGGPATGKKVLPRENYLLVDGYNIIFAWEDLRNLAARNIDAARDKLIEILSNFQGTRSGHLILVFDAYKVHGGRGEVYRYGNIDVVFTKEAETADTYIVRTAHSLKNRGTVTVATSDGIIQIIIFGDGASRMSARELQAEVRQADVRLREEYHTDL